MHEEFGTPRTKDEKIESLIHQYVDGGLHRRDLIRRLARLAGGSAAALMLLETAGLAQVQPPKLGRRVWIQLIGFGVARISQEIGNILRSSHPGGDSERARES